MKKISDQEKTELERRFYPMMKILEDLIGEEVQEKIRKEKILIENNMLSNERET